jgi:hypothetical protein
MGITVEALGSMLDVGEHSCPFKSARRHNLPEIAINDDSNHQFLKERFAFGGSIQDNFRT